MASTLRKINDVVGTEALRHLDAGRPALYGDDGRGAHQPRSDRGTEANRTLGEDCDNVADADVAALSAGEPGGHDVGAHQHLLVSKPARDGGKVRHGVRHEHVSWQPSMRTAVPVKKDRRLSLVLTRGIQPRDPPVSPVLAGLASPIPARPSRWGDRKRLQLLPCPPGRPGSARHAASGRRCGERWRSQRSIPDRQTGSAPFGEGRQYEDEDELPGLLPVIAGLGHPFQPVLLPPRWRLRQSKARRLPAPARPDHFLASSSHNQKHGLPPLCQLLRTQWISQDYVGRF